MILSTNLILLTFKTKIMLRSAFALCSRHDAISLLFAMINLEKKESGIALPIVVYLCGLLRRYDSSLILKHDIKRKECILFHCVADKRFIAACCSGMK